MSTSSKRSARRPRVEPLEHRALLSALPSGSEFRINSFTTNAQVFGRVVAAPDGSFVVSYASTGQAGPSGTAAQDVYARRFDASGAPIGAEFLVNTYTTNHQELPAIAMDNSGNFVIVWHSWAQDNGGSIGVYGQRFNAAGVPQGGEFLVNETTIDNQQYPTVAMDADGDFVIAWENASYDEYNVWARRYNAAGVPQGGEFLASNTVTGLQASSTVAMDDAGDFIIAWGANQPGSTSYDIYARRFDTAGTALGTEFKVNTTTASRQYFPWVAADGDGDFVVAWQSNLQDTSGYGVYAQRYNSSGAAQGAEFRVNTNVVNAQQFAYVSMNFAGDFVVAWDSLSQDGDAWGTYAKAYRADGTPSGGEFRANTFTAEDQSFSSVALADNNRVIVTWQSRNQDGDSFGVYAQRYELDAVAPSVTGSVFHFTTKPHKLRISFTEDISASLQASDVTVTTLPGGPVLALQLDGYDTGTNTATFSFPAAPNGGVLPDGRYRATINAATISDVAGNSLAPAAPYDFFFMMADANHDGFVNTNDFTILATNFGLTGRNFPQGDFNYDGFVNANDFTLLASRFGNALPAPVTVNSNVFNSKSRIPAPTTPAKRPADALREDLLA